MALVSRLAPQRIPIPHEPHEWVELRPLTAGQMLDLQPGADAMSAGELAVHIVLGALSAWSYDAPLTAESIRDLDADTFRWLTETAPTTGRRGEEERANLGSGSSPTSDPAAGRTLTSSGIS
jgi:hypothetical protein